MPVDKFGRMSDAKTMDTGVLLTYINNNYIRSDGGTPISGSINMNGNTLYSMPDPVNPQDVATKEYADKKTHIIAVSTYHCGDLIKGEYQFTFRGNKCEKSGFLMPHSGRLKKIKMRLIFKIGAPDEIIKITSDEINDKIDEDYSLADYWKDFFVLGDIFSLILFEKGNYQPTGSILSTYRCYASSAANLENLRRIKRKFDLDRDLKNYSLSEGDVINIRTETNRNLKLKCSFLFTFLIELDPLQVICLNHFK